MINTVPLSKTPNILSSLNVYDHIGIYTELYTDLYYFEHISLIISYVSEISGIHGGE
jgi:hypothetical protein